jgi:hypothetical protein
MLTGNWRQRAPPGAQENRVYHSYFFCPNTECPIPSLSMKLKSEESIGQHLHSRPPSFDPRWRAVVFRIGNRQKWFFMANKIICTYWAAPMPRVISSYNCRSIRSSNGPIPRFGMSDRRWKSQFHRFCCLTWIPRGIRIRFNSKRSISDWNENFYTILNLGRLLSEMLTSLPTKTMRKHVWAQFLGFSRFLRIPLASWFRNLPTLLCTQSIAMSYKRYR